MTTCKRCGSTAVEWYQTKAGKWMLIVKGGAPKDGHHKDCGVIPVGPCTLLGNGHWGDSETGRVYGSCCQTHKSELLSRMAEGAQAASRAMEYHTALNRGA